MTAPADADRVGGEGRWSRRRFVRFSAMAAVGAVLGLGAWLRRSFQRDEGMIAGPAGALSTGELANVAALAEVIFPPEDEQEARELARAIRWWAEGRTGRGPHLGLYRDGLRVLAAATRSAGYDGRFSDLSASDRGRITAAAHAAANGDGAFHTLVSELADGIYATAPGWHSLGYTTWPGEPSPPLEYTRPPGTASRLTSAAAGGPARR